jgi:hypothetical protein
MDSLFLLIVGAIVLVGIGVFLSDTVREKSGKNIHDKNDKWNFLGPVLVVFVIYAVVMLIKG